MTLKLAFRNVKRSARDYLVYFLTMMLVTAVMFAFHSLLFSKDVQKLFKIAMLMQTMIGLASFFIVLIIAWLINYMVRFMLEKRSREFAIYLLIGMTKREISRLYIRENLLLGIGAFAGGLVFGTLLQQILMAVFYSMIQMEYQIQLDFNRECLLTTAACYGGCYMLALIRCRHKFKKLTITALINTQRQNEEIKESHEMLKRWLLPFSAVFLLIFDLFLFFYKDWNTGTLIGFLTGLILTIYLFYTGLGAWIICYVRRKGNAIYQKHHLFLFRQFSSKIKTMRFTLGTLTSLFTLALLGCATALMFNNYENDILITKWPFDIQIYSENLNDDFTDQLEIIRTFLPGTAANESSDPKLQETFSYPVYQYGTRQVNCWLYTHLNVFGNDYQKSNGTPDWNSINADENTYYYYDTCLALSDYNHLRNMIGLPAISLAENEYALHLKERIWKETGDFSADIKLPGPNNDPLHFAGAYTEPFSQDGHNGADYMIIVPDHMITMMQPYYMELVASLNGKVPDGLQTVLDNLPVNEKNESDFNGHVIPKGMCTGSDMIISYASKTIVRDNLVPEVKFMLSSIIFPLFYAGLIFVCVALTVLSVQQLSDSSKYKFRYKVLHQIGLSHQEISVIIFKQLAAFYLCPILFAACISGVIAIYEGQNFNFITGAHTAAAGYFAISCAVFLGVYVFYFVLTYIGFRRNVQS